MIRSRPPHSFMSRITAACGVFALTVATAAAATPVTVTAPWFRYLLPTIPAGGYMTLSNRTDTPIVLTGAHSSACRTTMLHKSLHKNGVDEMLPVKSVTVPAHGSFSFSPGHYHVMCMHPHMKPGESVPVVLEFAGQPSLTVNFTVYGAAGQPGTE